MVQKHHFFKWYSMICRAAVPIFFAVWIVGLLLGTLTGALTQHWYDSWIRAAAESRVTILGLLASTLLPFVLAGFALSFQKPLFLYFICFIKTFSFAHSAFSAMTAFGQAGWLVRFLFQFSEIISIPALFWFCLGQISGRSRNRKRDFWISSGVAAIACGIDYCVVSPFLTMLIEV